MSCKEEKTVQSAPEERLHEEHFSQLVWFKHINEEGPVESDSRHNVPFHDEVDIQLGLSIMAHSIQRKGMMGSGKDLSGKLTFGECQLSGYKNPKKSQPELFPDMVLRPFGVRDGTLGSIDSTIDHTFKSAGTWAPQLLSLRRRTYTKVYKRGSVGRSIDITRYSGYQELKQYLAWIFGIEGQLGDRQREGWQILYVDHENDILFVGGDPWECMDTLIGIGDLNTERGCRLLLNPRWPNFEDGRPLKRPREQGMPDEDSSDDSDPDNLFKGAGTWAPQLLSLRRRTYTKVYKRGSVGRSIDITRYSGYQELKQYLARIFGIEGQLGDRQRGCWQILYVDHENDILFVGGDPWEEFVSCVRLIKVISPQELQQMSLDGDFGNAIQPNHVCGSSNGIFSFAYSGTGQNTAVAQSRCMDTLIGIRDLNARRGCHLLLNPRWPNFQDGRRLKRPREQGMPGEGSSDDSDPDNLFKMKVPWLDDDFSLKRKQTSPHLSFFQGMDIPEFFFGKLNAVKFLAGLQVLCTKSSSSRSFTAVRSSCATISSAE